jgi:hypothetical protein
MDDSNTIEPFGFFTLDALRAGWYLVWRLLVRLAIGGLVLGVLFGLLTALGLAMLGVIVLGLGIAALVIWSIVLLPQITIQWAEQWYGATLTGRVRIWWGVVWRAFVASLVAAVVLTPPNFVAMSLSTAFKDSPLGMLGGALTVLLGLVNFVVSLLADGWAMSKVAVGQIASGAALVSAVSETAEPIAPASPLAEPEPVAAVEPVAVAAPVAPPPARSPAVAEPVAVAPPVAPRPTPAPAVAAPPTPSPVAAPRPAAATDKRQCPKCSLYETERGTVIGWYCKVCGWREGKSR